MLWAWLLARSVLFGLLVMWGVWWVSWRWFDRSSQTIYLVRRGGDQWMVFERLGLWERSMVGIREPQGEQVSLGMNYLRVQHLQDE